MTYKKPNNIQHSLDFIAIFKGTAVAIAFTLMSTFFLGMTYHFSGLGESTLPIVTSILLFISVFLGGFTASRQSKSKGLYHGLGTGIVVFLLIWLLMVIFIPTGTTFIPLMQKLFVCLVGGTLGGIFGVSI